jgi:hypothetical protein
MVSIYRTSITFVRVIFFIPHSRIIGDYKTIGIIPFLPPANPPDVAIMIRTYFLLA